MRVNIKDQYIDEFESFISSLPKDAITIKKSLDDEITQRISDYQSGKMKTTTFGTGLNDIRDKLTLQC
jgi:S-adenosylmethionine hydrolase